MPNKKFIAVIFCITIIMGTIFIIASCDNSNNQNTNPGNIVDNTEGDLNQSNSDIEEPAEKDRASVPDNVPPDLKFSGNTFTILSREEFQFGTEMGVDEENGDIVNDAVFRRNKAIEDRFDITIDVIKIPGIWGKEASFNNTVKNSVKAGDNAYDLIAGYAAAVTPLATDGVLLNWNKVPYIDYGAPWWIEKLADELTVDGKLYFITGDLSQTMIGSMMMFFFNKRLQSDYAAEDLYQTVLDGKWTYDKLYSISKEVYKDANGDGIKNVGDTFGLGVETGNFTDLMFVSMGMALTERGDDGLPYIVAKSPKASDILEKLLDLFYENPGVYRTTETTERPTREMFRRGESLFYIGMIVFAEDLRDMKDDFGIIPSPKYDENQEKYQGLTQDAFSLFSVPSTCDRLEFVGAVTEAMAAESYRYVTPAYYETALKIKYARDDVTSQMLDIIRGGIYFDFGYVNTLSMGGIHFLFRDLVEKNSRDFISAYEKNEQSYEKAMEKLLEAYKDLD